MPSVLEPLVAGQLGDGTLLDASTHPPLVSRVQYVLDAPTSDDLIESFPVFLVSEALGSALMEAALEGIGFDEAETVPSDEYVATYGSVPHKRYRWLKVEPSQVGDCWLDENYRLVVSDRMYAVIEQHEVGGCDVTPLG
jgi:hypothetical protein